MVKCFNVIVSGMDSVCSRGIRMTFVLVSFGLLGPAVFAANWTGGGDGKSWSDAANWGGALPGDNDAVTIQTGSSDLEIDVGNVFRQIKTLAVSGTGALNFTGTGASATLYFKSMDAYVPVAFDVPVRFWDYGDNVIRAIGTTIDFKKDVQNPASSGVAKTTYLGTGGNAKGHVYFRETFTATGAGTVNVLCRPGSAGATTGATVEFFGKVTATTLSAGRNYYSGWTYLRAADNEIGTVELAFSGINLMAENALSDTTVITWNDYYSENNEEFGSYDFHGFDQVAEAIRHTTTKTGDECRYLRSKAGPMTLTLKGASDASANCYVKNNVSITWDPVGDFTQEFALKASTADGTITVKRGAVKIANGATFAKLQCVDVKDNASFVLDTGVSGALASLASLKLGAGAKLSVSATSTTPFANANLAVEMGSGALIQAETAVVVGSVKTPTGRLAKGVYGAGATAADWVKGSGTVEVLGNDPESKETRVWTGAGDGETWASDANWDTESPHSKDTASFTNTVTITSPVVLDDARIVTVAAGCMVTLAGQVTGEADWTKLGEGELVLTGSNTFTGTLSIERGRLTARGDCALGDNAEGMISLKKENDPSLYNLTLGGVTIRKTLAVNNVNDSKNGYSSQILCEAGTVNTTLGAVQMPNSSSYLRLDVAQNAKFVMAGGGTMGHGSFFAREEGAEVVVRNTPIIHKIYDDVYPNGKLVFDCVGNTLVPLYPEFLSYGAKETIETRVNGALSAATDFRMGTATAKLDLMGTTQTVSRIVAVTTSDTDLTPLPGGEITSAQPAKLTFTSDSTYTNSQAFTGAVSLEQAGSGTLCLVAASTTSGEFISTSGTTYFTDGAAWQGPVVLKGGLVRLSANALLGAASTVAFNGGSIELPQGADCLIGGATDANGDPLPPGCYSGVAAPGVTVLPGLLGEGTLTVLPQGGAAATYTWTGKGDRRFNSAENWQGETLPDFTSPNATYIFPDADSEAIVDVNVMAKDFRFTAAEPGTVRLTAASDKVAVFLVDGSLEVAGCPEEKSVSIGVPLRYCRSLSVHVGSPTDKTTSGVALWTTNGIVGIGAGGISKDGYGDWRLSGAANRLKGDVTLTTGFLTVAGTDPLGGTGSLKIDMASNDSSTGLRLNGATVTCPCDVKLSGAGYVSQIVARGQTTNRCTRPISVSGNHLRIQARSQAELSIEGGMTLSGQYFCPSGDTSGSSRIIVAGVPIQSASWYWADSEDLLTVEFACAGNSFSQMLCFNSLCMSSDGAFASGQKLTFSYQNASKGLGSLDLADTVQELAVCHRNVTVGGNGVVTALSGARVTGTAGSSLTLTGATDEEVLPVFAGSAEFVNSGTATRRLRNSCTSDGALRVTGGRLVLEAPGAAYNGVAQSPAVFEGGRWSGTNVTVSAGVLQACHNSAINRRSNIMVADGGTIDIPSGVTIVCRELYVDGKLKDPGSYTASNLGSVVSGGGVLVSRGKNPGAVLLVR